MENTWASQAYVFIGCATTGADFNCKEAPKAFAASCEEVASPLFKVATKENFFEYMNDVCTKMQLGWHQATCQKVGTLVDAEMSASTYENRNSAEQRAQKACGAFWSHSVAQQEAKAKKEKAKEEEDAKKEKAQDEKEEKEEDDSKKEKAKEEKEAKKEANNAKPVSFLQEGLSEAEKVYQQQELAKIQAHEAEMEAGPPPPSDELVEKVWKPESLVQENDERRVATQAEEEEMLRKRAKREEEKKQENDWINNQVVMAQGASDMIMKVVAARKTQKAEYRRANNYDLAGSNWY